MDIEAEKGMAIETNEGMGWTLYAYVILILPFDKILESRVRSTLFLHQRTVSIYRSALPFLGWPIG
jgi:hypothetical protein